jgi:alpha-mannosidase
MIPYASDYFEAVDLADQFQTTMTAVATSRQTGEAPQRVSLVSTDQAEFQITAIKTAEDGEGIIMRGVNLADHPIDLSITFGIPFQSLKRCRLDETDLEQIELQQASRVDLVLADGEILTLKGIPQQVVQS